MTDTVTSLQVSAVSAVSQSCVEAAQAIAPDHKSAAQDFFAFGPYRLFPRQRLLLKDGTALPVGNRSLDILILLAERQGEIVAKNELIARAWPGINIDEGGLRVHVAGLRKALGDGIDDACYIRTVVGRGYCLVTRPAMLNLSAEGSPGIRKERLRHRGFPCRSPAWSAATMTCARSRICWKRRAS